jgi:hypothetical protein
MKKIVLINSFFFFGFMLNAQPPTYHDLMILFTEGNYKKVVKQAEKYTLKDATKDDAMAYYWLGKGLYKLSFQNIKDDEFENAYKDGIAYLGKCKKKDKTGEVFEKEIDFFHEVKSSMMEQIMNEITLKQYKKATEWCKRIYLIFPDDVATKYMDAACKYQLNDQTGAAILWNECQKPLEKMQSIDQLNDTEKDFFCYAITKNLGFMKEFKQQNMAKLVGQKGNMWFSENSEFKQAYESVK